MTDTALTPAPGPRLRRVLWIDAAACLACGLLLATAAAPLAAITGLPALFLSVAGMLLLGSAAFMAATAAGRLGAGWAVQVIVWGNVAWVLASLAVAFGIGGLTPTPAGIALVLAQAAAVLGLALAEAKAR